MYIFPPTTKRVPIHSNRYVNEKIRLRTLANAADYQNACEPELTRRLYELDHEWDTERVLATGAGAMVLAGTLLGVLKSPRWLWLTGAAGLFLLQHALVGWCPPMPIMRRLGVRTQDEISVERELLKQYRGDYEE